MQRLAKVEPPFEPASGSMLQDTRASPFWLNKPDSEPERRYRGPILPLDVFFSSWRCAVGEGVDSFSSVQRMAIGAAPRLRSKFSNRWMPAKLEKQIG